MVATYIQEDSYALIEVKDKSAKRVGKYQKVSVGDKIDGFSVDKITSGSMRLSSGSQRVIVKVFERP